MSEENAIMTIPMGMVMKRAQRWAVCVTQSMLPRSFFPARRDITGRNMLPIDEGKINSTLASVVAIAYTAMMAVA